MGVQPTHQNRPDSTQPVGLDHVGSDQVDFSIWVCNQPTKLDLIQPNPLGRLVFKGWWIGLGCGFFFFFFLIFIVSKVGFGT